MGAWDSMRRARLAPRLPDAAAARVAAALGEPRPSGSATRHKLEQEQLVREALGEPVSRLARAPRAAQER